MTINELRVGDITWRSSADEALLTVPHNIDDLLTDLIIEAQGYRELARQAIHWLHDLQVKLTRLQAAHDRLIEDYRTLRISVRRDREAA